MTTNPSYATTTSTGLTKSYLPSSVSFSNPMFNNYTGLGGGAGDTPSYTTRYDYKSRAAAAGEGRSHYSDTGAMSTSRKYGNSK